jgi:hypothetical protein
MKIVINTTFGGFGLSHKGIMRYAELKGIKLYSREGYFSEEYYLVEPEVYDKIYEKCKVNGIVNGIYEESNDLCFYEHNLERNDPILVQVVEELDEESWGKYAELKVVNIPDNIEWYISDYDGVETIHENHEMWS